MHQDDNWLMSVSSSSWSSVEVMHFTNFVSSANRNGLADEIHSGRSLIKIINNSGPRMLPCRTPDIAGKWLDGVLITLVKCILSCR